LAENVDNKAVPVVGQDSVVSYQCPNCGGPLHFGDETLTNCDHCGTEVQKIPPPIKMTSPGQSDDDRKRSDEEDLQQPRPAGAGMGMFPLYYYFLFAAIAHSNYTSQYTGTSATHPAHIHGVGGFGG